MFRVAVLLIVVVTMLVLALVRMRFASSLNLNTKNDPSNTTDTKPPSFLVPQHAHAIYMPWDVKTQTLLQNQDDFDHTWFNTMKQQHPAWSWTLWSHDALWLLLQQHYPAWYSVLRTKPLSRPTMFVDIMRWVVVYHFGGVYIQYNSRLIQAPDALVPHAPYRVTLLTEVVLNTTQCRLEGKKHPIRAGVPEEPVRVANQAFASVVRHPYVRGFIEFILAQHVAHDVSEDYDILYIVANAAASTFWDQHHAAHPDVQLWSNHKHVIQFSSTGSWRTDAFKSKSTSKSKSQSTPSSFDAVSGVPSVGSSMIVV
jgi:hypothetical protein